MFSLEAVRPLPFGLLLTNYLLLSNVEAGFTGETEGTRT